MLHFISCGFHQRSWVFAGTKSFQDAVILACAAVHVIPHGPYYMANGRVEMAVREVKRHCRTLRISAEQNTSVRIADDSPLLSWLPRLAAQVMNKMRIGEDKVGRLVKSMYGTQDASHIWQLGSAR